MRTALAAATLQIFLILITGVRAASATTGLRDPFFENLPFDNWSAEGNQSVLPWSVEFVPVELSGHQRLLAGVRITIDGRKLAKRQVNEQLFALVQFEDESGTVWQTHTALKPGSGGDISFIQNAFVLPGEYVVAAAVCDARGSRHSFVHKKVHANAPKADPLPELWDGVPRVEFFHSGMDSPDGWFLPEIETRLRLPVQTRHPVHIEVLVNTTPGDRSSGRIGELRRNMSAVIPSLKVISQMSLQTGSMGISFLDLDYRQETSVKTWDDMRAFFARNNPSIIDVKALDGKRKMKNFFLERVKDRVRTAGETERIVIVLSGPAFLEGQEPTEPIAIPGGSVPRVFYIRCRSIPRSVLEPRPRPRPGVRPRPPQRFAFALPLDDLERPLDSPGARIFDVVSAEQFRRVLAGMMAQIAKM